MSSGSCSLAALAKLTGPDWPQWLAVDQSNDKIIVDAIVGADTTWFKGHFDGHPVLPGVAQVNWAGSLAMHFFPQYTDFERLHNIKFVNLLLPEAKIAIELRDIPERSAVDFVIVGDDQRYSSGRVVFCQP